MGIAIEFNPELTLRNFSEFQKGNRKQEECIPENLEAGKTYTFLKKGQRNYYLHGEVPLRETKGNGDVTRPLAAVKIFETTHYLNDREVYTKGKFFVTKILTGDDLYFDGLEPIQ